MGSPRFRDRACAGEADPWPVSMDSPRFRDRACAGEAVLLDDLDQGDDLVARDPVGELRMIAAEMVQGEVDNLILGLAADDLAALACDLPGHDCYRERWSPAGLSRMLTETLERG